MALRSGLERRYANTRKAMAGHELDALIVSGTEYTGFEGSVIYMSGFQVVHRYAYVVLPADGDAIIVADPGLVASHAALDFGRRGATDHHHVVRLAGCDQRLADALGHHQHAREDEHHQRHAARLDQGRDLARMDVARHVTEGARLHAGAV